MRKNNSLCSLLMLIVFLLTGYSAAKAATTEVEFGTTYRFAAFSDQVYSITVAEAGTLTVSTTVEGDFKAGSGKINKTTRVSNGTPKVIEYQVAAGTYTYSISFSFDAGSIKFEFEAEGSGEQEVGKFVTTDPVPGSTFNAGGFDSTFDVFLTPEDVKVGSVSFIYTDEEGVENTIPNVTIMNTTFGKQKVVKILRPSFIDPDGKTNSNGGERLSFGGTEVKYVLNNVTYNGEPVNASDYTGANVSVDNGTITLTFQVETPVKLVSEEWPALLSKNYPATPAVTGTMTFDGNVKSVEEVSVVQGKSVPGAVGGENDVHVIIPKSNVSISGKTITIDFAGVNLSSIPAGNATIMVKGITGSNDLMASFDGYSEYVYYTELGEAPIEFVSIDPKDWTEVTLTEADEISFHIKYSGPVKIFRALYKNANLECSNVDGEEYASEWKLTFPKSAVQDLIYGWTPEDQEDSGISPMVFTSVYAVTEANYKAWEAAVQEDPNANPVYVQYDGQDYVEAYYLINYDFETYGFGAPFVVEVGKEFEEEFNQFAVTPGSFESINANDGNSWDGQTYVNLFKAIEITGPNDFKANATGYENGVVTFAPAATTSGTYTISIPYGAFTVVNSAGEGALNDEFYNTKKMVVTEDITIGDETPDVNVLPLETEYFFPKPNEKYYFTPDQNGTLKLDFDPAVSLTDNWFYTEEGTPVAISAHDGTPGIMDGWFDGVTYVTYELTEGTKYYFEWNKNLNSDDYPVYAVFPAPALQPLGDPEIEPTKKTFSGFPPTFIASWNDVQWADLEEDSYKVLSEDEMKQIKVYFNGVENTAWLSWMGAEVRVANTQGTNNQGAEGDADTDNGEGTYKVANISIYLGDMAKYFIPDDTEIKIVIPAGFETTTDGQPTPEVVMTFTKVPLTVEELEIAPESGHEFVDEVPAFTVTIEDDLGMNYQSSNVTYTVNGGAPIEITGDNMKALKDFGYFGSQASSIKVTLGDLPKEPGTYTYVVNIPKNGWQIMNLYDEEAELPEAITLTYTLTVSGPQLVTFTVAGEDNYTNLEYAALTLEEFMGDPTEFAMQPMTSDSFEVLLNAGEGPTNVVILKPAEGYTMTISCDVPEYAGEGAYTWQNMSAMFSAVDSETQVFIGLGAGAVGATFDITLTEIVEPEPALVAEDFEMTFTKGQTAPVTKDIYVSLENVEDMYSYAGYQFDITLPFGMVVTEAALGTGIVGMEGYEQPISVAKVDNMPPTTYRVLGFFEPTTATEKIAKLTISGVYNQDMEDGEEYEVKIQNSVVFSTPQGGDKKDIAGSVSKVTIYIDENLAEKVTIESCKLLWPSYTSRTGNIKDITAGQAVELTAVLEPTTAADELTWTATVNGSENLDIQVSAGSDEDDNNLVAVISTDWELLNLTEDITVVIRAQGENEDVYAEYPLTVKPIVLGDANDNGVVNVADVVTTANYITNNNTPATIAQFVEEFDLPNADVNQNNNSMEGSVNGINVTDVTAIVNIALGTQTGRSVRRYTGSYVSSDRLVAARVSDSSIAVALDGQTAYAALQVEIEMPAGMSVYGVEKGARAAAHELNYGVNAKGNVVVVLYSLDNSSFADGEGSLFTLQVEGGNAEDMRLVNAFASDARSNGYELEGVYSSEVTGIFGIEAELASGVRYYTVDGVQVVNPAKGQILIRVQNGESTKVLVK